MTAKKIISKDEELLGARTNFSSFLATGKSFTELKTKTALKFYKQKLNTAFESIGCVGYNPRLEELTATINIKRPTGYSGKLCSEGSYEYVRFYLDYGSGWQDVGFVGLNVHDIPTEKDCDSKLEKPLVYAVRLKISPKELICTKPNLPKVKAVLTWNTIPAPNDPNLTSGTYVWGDVKEEYIQIKSKPVFSKIPDFDFGPLFEKLVLNPNLSLKNLGDIDPVYDKLAAKAKNTLTDNKADFSELAELYNKKESKVEAPRFAAKLLSELTETKSKSVIDNIQNLFEFNNLSLVESLAGFQKLKCNTNYEELFCAGLDYHKEALVGTLKIKRPYGYNGDLCKKGSKEYVSFWVQEDDSCKWRKLGTSSVNVHDIPIPVDGLSYSVILPYDFSKFKLDCEKPRVLKLRAVLSWNTPPKGMDCQNYGNVIESYIQIPPKVNWDGKSPKIITLGGLSTDFIDDVTGLSLPGAKFEFNQVPVTYNNSPFGGVMVVQGISAPYAGQKYRIKITNHSKGGSYYLKDPLVLLGYNPGTGTVTHPVITPDPVDHYYTYQPYHNNIGSVLARFSPGTNDLLEVTIEMQNGATDSQKFQMDSTTPELNLAIDDNGDCTHYNKGDIINGTFSLSDNYVGNWKLSTNICNCLPGASLLIASGTTNHSGSFTVDTNVMKNCGEISLVVYQKRIYNSVRDNLHNEREKIVCINQ